MNAHPFEHGKIIGVHNGTLTQQWQLDDNRQYDVDSDNIFHHLNKNGIEKTANKLVGAFAIIYHDENDGTINIFRNDERPLHYMMSEDGKTMYVGSEALMLLWVLDRNGVKYDTDSLKAFDTKKLYKINPEKLKKNGLKGGMEVTDLEYFQKPKQVARTTSPYTTDWTNVRNEFKKAGIEQNTQYPMRITGWIGSGNSFKTFNARMMCPPYLNVECRTYNKITEEEFMNRFEEKELFSCNVSYSNYDKIMLIYPSGVRKMSKKVEAMIDESPVGDVEAYCMNSSGTAMTKEEFEKTDAHKHGCCVCADVINPALEDFTWVQNDNAMCESCAENDSIYNLID